MNTELLRSGPDHLPFVMTKPRVDALLQCSTRHIDNLARRGLLPVIHLGRSVRYRRESVIKAVERLESRAFE